MSLTHALRVMDALTPEDVDFGHQLLQTVTRDGQVIFSNLLAFDSCLRMFGFRLEQRDQQGVVPPGWHLFYVRGALLLRVKTSGTFVRRRPHMTLSAACGLSWDEEVSKFTTEAIVPKVGITGRLIQMNDWRLLSEYYGRTGALDDAWANRCHFDFVQPFNATGAASLEVG